jgi:hypothetical protein
MQYTRSIPYFVAWLIVLAILAFALQPVLTRSHLEGFTYLTETMSILAPEYTAAEPLWSAGADYFYFTRPGTIWAMVPFSDISPGNGYYLLMWVATPMFLSGLVIASKTWSGASWIASFSALLFVPITLEANFFTNDNILAAGLSLWGIVLLLRADRLGFVMLAGGLLCLAVLCRLDQVLLAPLFVALAVLKVGTLKAAVARCFALGLGFSAISLSGLLFDPEAVNTLGRISVVKSVIAHWGYSSQPIAQLIHMDISSALIAFGLGLPVLVPSILVVLQTMDIKAQDRIHWLGVSQAWAYMILILVYPLFVYALTVGKYLDPRGFLTISPMLAVIVARGLDGFIFKPLLIRGEFGKETYLHRGLIFLMFFGALLVPSIPQPRESESAPQYLFGRIWSAGDWRAWQTRFFASEAVADSIITKVSETPVPAVVVTWDWTLDRQFQNRLAATGFRPSFASEAVCLQNTEVWTHPEGAKVYHLRLHIPFHPYATTNTTMAAIAGGFDCMRSFPEEARYSHGGARSIDWARPLFANTQTKLGWFQITDETLESIEEEARLWVVETGIQPADIDSIAQQSVLDVADGLNPK